MQDCFEVLSPCDYAPAMHLAHLRLRDFRNYARLDADFPPGFHLLLGSNAGQNQHSRGDLPAGHPALFRGVGAQMVRHGQKGTSLAPRSSARARGDQAVLVGVRAADQLNGQPIRRLMITWRGAGGGVLHRGPAIVKGPEPAAVSIFCCRRRAAYLPLLQRYQALRCATPSSNSVTDEAALDSFTREVVAAGNEIMRWRREFTPRLSPLVRLAYRKISNGAEDLRLDYQPSAKVDFAVELAQARSRERIFRTTVCGPHRDELRLLLDEKPVAQFASEGQKRTLAIALKMAQAEYVTGLHGAPPILVIDDVMGELDAKRRSGLLPLIERSHQQAARCS